MLTFAPGDALELSVWLGLIFGATQYYDPLYCIFIFTSFNAHYNMFNCLPP